ncbi:MAG: hypothetical protein H7X71_01365 [Chitinophagales bacterium]|nr:hypothetical protein [Chitinophagales bacterium]
MNIPYKPVSCDLYDHLSALSVHGKRVSLEIRDETGESKKLTVQISDIVTKNKEEFLITDTGDSIRLDRIISWEGIDVT